jgi:hypothetical protein
MYLYIIVCSKKYKSYVWNDKLVHNITCLLGYMREPLKYSMLPLQKKYLYNPHCAVSLIGVKIPFAKYYALQRKFSVLSPLKTEAELHKENIKDEANFAVVFFGSSLPSPVSWNKQALTATQR